MLLLMIFSSFFVLLLPGAASPPPAPFSSRDSSSPPALLPSFFTPSSPLLSPSFTVILRRRRGRKEGGTQSGQGVPRAGRETPGLRGEKFSCRNSSQHGRRCLLLNPLSFAVPTQQPVPKAGGGKPRHNPPQTLPNGSQGPPAVRRLRPEGLRAAFGREIARPNSGVWQRSPAPEERQPLGRQSRRERGSAAPSSHPIPPLRGPRALGSPLSSPRSRGPARRGGGIHAPGCSSGFCSSMCVSGAGTGRGSRGSRSPPPPPRTSPRFFPSGSPDPAAPADGSTVGRVCSVTGNGQGSAPQACTPARHLCWERINATPPPPGFFPLFLFFFFFSLFCFFNLEGNKLWRHLLQLCTLASLLLAMPRPWPSRATLNTLMCQGSIPGFRRHLPTFGPAMGTSCWDDQFLC